MESIKCLLCEKEFKTYPSRIKKGLGKFCSKKCWYNFKSLNGNKEICDYCKKEFFRSPAKVRKHKFCSKECQLKSNYRKGKSIEELVGKEKSKTWKNKMSKAKKGKTHEEIFGKEETERRKRIIKEKVHPKQIGKKRHDVVERWKRLRLPYNYDVTSKELQKLRKHGQYKTWQKKVLERDNYTCIKCQSKKDVEADHIIPICKNRHLMLDLNNGQTLCKKCHKIKTKEDIYGNNKKLGK